MYCRYHASGKQAAREPGCDEDEARWDAALMKVAKRKPLNDKPE
jgi:hypothetical protein